MISRNPAVDKPTFLIIPGPWHSPTVYSDVCKILSARGYDHEYVLLDTIGADPPLETFWPDVNSVRAAIDDLLAEGRDIVIAMHSCGSIAVAEALQKYIDENGKFKPGKNGAKVTRLAYLASFPMQEGQCLYDDIGHEDLPWWKIENNNVNVINPQEVFYNDMPAEVAEKHIVAMSTQSYCVMHEKVSCAPWRYIPSAYLFTENDNALHVDRQRRLVKNAQTVEPKSFDMLKSLNTSHCPFLSQPKEVAQWLIEAAGGN